MRCVGENTKAVVCLNPMPLLTQDSHCTQKKHTSNIPVTAEQLSSCMKGWACCSLSVCAHVRVCCLQKPHCLLHNQIQISTTVPGSLSNDILLFRELRDDLHIINGKADKWKSKCYTGQRGPIPERSQMQVKYKWNLTIFVLVIPLIL